MRERGGREVGKGGRKGVRMMNEFVDEREVIEKVTWYRRGRLWGEGGRKGWSERKESVRFGEEGLKGVRVGCEDERWLGG